MAAAATTHARRGTHRSVAPKTAHLETFGLIKFEPWDGGFCSIISSSQHPPPLDSFLPPRDALKKRTRRCAYASGA